MIKKIIASMLLCTMVFSMAACSGENANTPTESVPSTSTPDATLNTLPSEPEAGDNATQNAWVIKEAIETPQFEAPQLVHENMQLLNGSAIKVGRYQAAWSKIKPEDVKERVEPLLVGWTWKTVHEEIAYAEKYADAGWQRDYDYSVRLIASSPEVDYISDTITISFVGDTSEYDGWRGISVNYSTPGRETNSTQQEFLLPIMEQVFGKQSAEYMLYAPVTDQRYDEMTLSEANTIGSESYSRRLDDNTVYCALYAYNNTKTGADKYAGNYVSILNNGVPEYSDVVFPNLGPIQFGDIQKISADFVSQHLNNYDFTEPGSSDTLYTYKVTKYDNGDKDVNFHGDLNVRQKDVSWLETLPFVLKYDVEMRDMKVKVNNASITMYACAEKWDNNDPEDASVIQRMSENLEKAKKTANAVFGTDFAFDSVHWNGSNDYKLTENCKAELYGRTVYMNFEFFTKTMDSISQNRAGFTISIY